MHILGMWACTRHIRDTRYLFLLERGSACEASCWNSSWSFFSVQCARMHSSNATSATTISCQGFWELAWSLKIESICDQHFDEAPAKHCIRQNLCGLEELGLQIRMRFSYAYLPYTNSGMLRIDFDLHLDNKENFAQFTSSLIGFGHDFEWPSLWKWCFLEILVSDFGQDLVEIQDLAW